MENRRLLFSRFPMERMFNPSFLTCGGRITLTMRREGQSARIAVADSGIGIPDEDRERVFGKFERANSQARQSGAGLGLSLVKSFVELHGGRIEIASQYSPNGPI